MSAQDLEQLPGLPVGVAVVTAKPGYAGTSAHVRIPQEPGAQLYSAQQVRDLMREALRQQPAPVDLEQFRLAVAAFKVVATQAKQPDVISEADHLLSIIDNAGKVEPPLADETGPYPFGAGIEPNPKARYWQQRSAFWMAEALRLGYAPPGETPTHQPAPVVDDAAACRLDDYLSGEFSIRIGKQAARAALTAARAQGVQS